MTSWPGVRDWIQGLTPTTETQLALTVGVVAAALLLAFISGRLRAALEDRYDPAVVEAVQALLLGTAALGGMTVIAATWRASDEVARAVRVLELDAVLLVLSAFVAVSAYGITRLTRRFIRGFAAGSSAFSSHQREIAHHVVQVVVFILAGLVVLSLWNVDVGNLLLGAGVLGIVLGLAARQTLGAVLAGFVVLFSRPFEVGDWVIIDDREGVVREITIVNTRIQTFDGETVMIPNDAVTSTEVVNRSRKGRLRVNVEVGVDYTTDLDRAVEVAEDAMTGLDQVRRSPSPHAVVSEFDDSAVVLRLRFWIADPSARRYWRARSAVVAAVKQGFEDAGISIPFPQRELSGRARQGGLAVTGDPDPVDVEGDGTGSGSGSGSGDEDWDGDAEGDPEGAEATPDADD